MRIFLKYVAIIASALLVSACGASRPSDAEITQMLQAGVIEEANSGLFWIDMSAPDDFFGFKGIAVENGVLEGSRYTGRIKVRYQFNYGLSEFPQGRAIAYQRIFGDFAKGQEFESDPKEYIFIKGDNGWMLANN